MDISPAGFLRGVAEVVGGTADTTLRPDPGDLELWEYDPKDDMPYTVSRVLGFVYGGAAMRLAAPIDWGRPYVGAADAAYRLLVRYPFPSRCYLSSARADLARAVRGEPVCGCSPSPLSLS